MALEDWVTGRPGPEQPPEPPYFLVGEYVYFYLCSPVAGAGVIERAIGLVKGPPTFVGLVSSAGPVLGSINPGCQVTPLVLEHLIDSVEALFFLAYDGESYLLWTA